MPHELDQILISLSQLGQKGFDEKLLQAKEPIMQAAMFGAGDARSEDVAKILRKVGEEGDKAVAKYTKEFDDVCLTPQQFKVSRKELKEAHEEINKKLLESIRDAIENVKKYQAEIFVGKFKHSGIKYTPIKRVGICVPGASAPLPSTVVMTAVPAQVAGVKEIVVVTPPRYKGSIHPVILGVCHELGIDEVYRIGGAQAVAALAFGTETINKVYKIVGPGNKWVQTAKQKVFGIVDIDSIAGPSEVLIVANDKANPAWVAADMLSQAEHAPGSAFVLTDSQELAEKILGELEKQVKRLSRAKETRECLIKYSKIAVFNYIDGVIECANELASEHLEIQCGNESKEIAARIENAGAIFVGEHSPVAVGDYWAGPSHTLPTGMSAWFFSALSSNDFIKSTSIIEYDERKLAESAEDIIRLAEAEGLDAHAKSIRIRQQDL